MSVKPFSPDEVKKSALAAIPDFVISTVNDLLVENYRNGSKRVILKLLQVKLAIRQAIAANDTDKYYSTDQISNIAINTAWLDFEDSFRAQGWIVKFDKPEYNENYDAYFEFKMS